MKRAIYTLGTPFVNWMYRCPVDLKRMDCALSRLPLLVATAPANFTYTTNARLSKGKFILLLALLAAASISNLSAQTFTNLYYFTALNPTVYTNFDGSGPNSLLLSGGTLFGTAENGGNGSGTVFAMNMDGSGFKLLHSFKPAAYDNSYGYTNLDGALPNDSLVLSGDTLYGTTYQGGTNGNGTIYSITTNGSVFTRLHVFTAEKPGPGTYTNVDGVGPQGGLVLSGTTLYGAAGGGGANGAGTIFSIATNGTDFLIIHAFKKGGYNDSFVYTNSEGAFPEAPLTMSGNMLYGTTYEGGTNGNGTVFSIATSSAGFTVLHTFNSASDGRNISSGLVLSGNTLYGTAYLGGPNGSGTVFSLGTNGGHFAVLYPFSAAGYDLVTSLWTNQDGWGPGGLVQSGNTLYGTTVQGTTNGEGMVFSINTDDNSFARLYGFTALDSIAYTNLDGASPGSLVLSGNTLYGTAGGGVNGSGTIFRLAPPSVLRSPGIAGISLVGANLIIDATNGVAGETCYVLASEDPTAPFGNWVPVATNILTATDNFTITATNAVNPAALQQFYILKVQ